jgi:UDP-glucuronate decarboxylase
MKNMLDLANVHHARVLFTSTSEVYGDPLVHPQHEEYSGNVNITGVRSCYDEGKRAAETLCADYRRKYCTDVVVTRLFNTYGPSMASNDGRVVSNFITQALDNKDITIYGDGSQTRSFCYVDDMVLILQSLMHRDELLPLPINVGNPEEYTIKDIAYLVQSMTMSGSKVVCKQLPEDDPKVRKPDTSRLCSIIGDVEYTPLNIGLQNTVDYFKSVSENAIHS